MIKVRDDLFWLVNFSIKILGHTCGIYLLWLVGKVDSAIHRIAGLSTRGWLYESRLA